MTKITVLLCGIMLFAAIGIASAQSGDTGTLHWEYENGTLTITGTGAMPDYSYSPWDSYQANVTSVVIGDGVTRIGNRAFYLFGQMITVSIGSSVTSIGNEAFRDCRQLTSLTIPASVTTIGESAFYGCRGLTSLTIPNTVTTVEAGAFRGCNALTSLVISNSLTTIGNSVFYECSSLTAVTIPNSVTSLDEKAFYRCYALTSVTIPQSVTAIGASAFAECTHLENVTLPSSVSSISNNTFAMCSGLVSVTIPQSVNSIGTGAFSGCYALSEIVNHAVTPQVITFYDMLYGVDDRDCVLRVPAGSIDAYRTAEGWERFLNIEAISVAVTGVNLNAENIILNVNDTETLVATVLPADASNSAVTWSSSNNAIATVSETGVVTAIAAGEAIITATTDDGGFTANCSVTVNSIAPCDNPIASGITGNLTWTLCPDSTLTITGTGAMPNYYAGGAPWYSHASSITAVVIGDGVTSVGYWAFSRCTLLRTASIGNTVTIIDRGSFNGCSSLVSINFPNSLEVISPEAFTTCSSLTSITIPASVTALEAAFSNCVALTEIVNHATTPQVISSGTFVGVDFAACTLRVPANSIEAYRAADVWKEFLIESITSNISNSTLAGITVYGSGSSICITNSSGTALNEIVITDLQGRVVYTRRGAIYRAPIETIHINGGSGIYVVKLLSDDNKTSSTKVHLTR